MSRPESLFPLFAELETLPGVGPKAAQAFKALGVERPKDLLYLLPHSGVDRALRRSVRDVTPPERDREVRELGDAAERHGIPWVLVETTAEAARHAAEVGLVTEESVREVEEEARRAEAEAGRG